MVTVRLVAKELRAHVPFTSFGTITGLVLMILITKAGMSRDIAASLFWVFHPVHVFLSALVTAGMYQLYGRGRLYQTILIGYFGSIGIATLIVQHDLNRVADLARHFGVTGLVCVNKWDLYPNMTDVNEAQAVERGLKTAGRIRIERQGSATYERCLGKERPGRTRGASTGT